MSRAHLLSIVSILGLVALEAILPQRFFPPSRFLVATTLMILSWSLVTDLSRRWTGRTPGVILAAAVAGLAANWALAMQPHQALVTATVWLIYLVVFLGVRFRLAPLRDGLLLGGLALLGGICSLWALDQALFGFREALDLLNRLDLPSEELFAARLRSGRVFGPFILPSAFGGFLILVLPATAWMAVRPGRTAMRIVWGLVAVLEAWALLWTGSHGAVLALAAALGLIALTRQPPRLRAALAVAAAAAVALLAVIVMARGGILLDPSDPRGPVGQRLGVWRSAAAMVGDHPLFGVGGGGFGIAFPSVRVAGIDETRFAHNSYLQLVAEYGVWVIVPVVLFLAGFFRRLWRREALSAREIFVTIGCSAFLIHNLVDFGLYLPATAVPFFAMLGMLYRAPATRPEWRAGGAAGWLPGLLLAAAATAAWILAGLWFASDREIDRAVLASRQGDTGEAIRRLERSIAAYPWRPQGWGFLAEVLYASASPDRAELERARQAALRAVELDPYMPFRHHLAGRIAYSMGDDSAAYVSLLRAARLYPLKEEYRESLRVVEARIDRRGAPDP